jgi:hypothetical protein
MRMLRPGRGRGAAGPPLHVEDGGAAGPPLHIEDSGVAGPPLRGRGRWGGIGAADRGRGVVESGAMGVAAPCWGRDDSERFARYCLESYLRHEFGPPELDQIPSFDSVVGQTG